MMSKFPAGHLQPIDGWGGEGGWGERGGSVSHLVLLSLCLNLASIGLLIALVVHTAQLERALSDSLPIQLVLPAIPEGGFPLGDQTQFPPITLCDRSASVQPPRPIPPGLINPGDPATRFATAYNGWIETRFLASERGTLDIEEPTLWRAAKKRWKTLRRTVDELYKAMAADRITDKGAERLAGGLSDYGTVVMPTAWAESGNAVNPADEGGEDALLRDFQWNRPGLSVRPAPPCLRGEHAWRDSVSAWILWDNGVSDTYMLIRVETCPECGLLRVAPRSLELVLANK